MRQFRIYPQLALNCGYYQIDLATLRHGHFVTPRDGIEEQIEDVRTFRGDVLIKRRRQKTLHQNDFETLCYVWLENVELLRRYAAPRQNPYGLVLLNENGLPLQRNKTNNITNRFQRYRKDPSSNAIASSSSSARRVRLGWTTITASGWRGCTTPMRSLGN